MEKIKRKYYTWDDVHKCAHKLALELYKSSFRPDYIVGITRGGNLTSLVLSYLIVCNLYTLVVRLCVINERPELNLWKVKQLS